MAVTVRVATREDIVAFVTMKNDAWRWAYAGILPAEHLAGLSVEQQADGWRAMFDQDADPGVAVALDGDRIVGVVSWGPTRDDDAPDETGEIGCANFPMVRYVTDL